MWFDPTRQAPDWAEAERHLSAVDPVLRRVIAAVGPCRLAPLPRPFEALVLSVFSQQLSVKGAETLYARFAGRMTRGTPTPRKIVAALDPASPACWDDATIRQCGVSRQKRAYLIDLSRHLIDRRLVLDDLATVDDATVIQKLTAVKGVGVWTAQMYLMFVLLRPDVWPVGDLGMREGVRVAFGHDARPTERELVGYADAWRPWRSVATWYLWKAKGE